MGRQKSPWADIKVKFKIYSTRKYHEIQELYESPAVFEKLTEENPYGIFIDVLNKTFKQADELTMQYYPQYRESPLRCKWCIWELLKKNESEGNTCVNANLLARVLKESYPEVYKFLVPIAKADPLFHYDEETKMIAIFYTWLAERKIAEAIKNRVANPIVYDMDWEKYIAVDGLDLTEEQMEILKLACTKSVIMLNGSAGTGKTSAMKALVEMVTSEGYGCTIVAPTGIAAKRIAEVTGHPASTIHKLLAKKDSYISDYLIIDEMSMVGVNLLGSLLTIVPESTKIVFVCDEAQLASISCGNIVQDIIDSGIVPIVKLNRVFRYGKGGIATVATDVRTGKKLSEDTEFNDYCFIPVSENPLKDVTKAYDALRESYDKEDIMILSPFNVRDSGTYAINKAIQNRYNDNPVLTSYTRQNTEIEFRCDDRIINTENNYHMAGDYGDIAIMNGEIGHVVSFDGEIMTVDYENGRAYLEKGDVFKQLLGYSITVHKSQGSQAKAVIVIADKSHSFFLSRNLLYVAMSRAQKKLIVIGDINTINESLNVEENKERTTWLKEMLIH